MLRSRAHSVVQAKLIRSVIKNMQKKDGLLVYVDGGLKGIALLALHPNVDI
jgi:hypothetical protein